MVMVLAACCAAVWVERAVDAPDSEVAEWMLAPPLTVAAAFVARLDSSEVRRARPGKESPPPTSAASTDELSNSWLRRWECLGLMWPTVAVELNGLGGAW